MQGIIYFEKYYDLSSKKDQFLSGLPPRKQNKTLVYLVFWFCTSQLH